LSGICNDYFGLQRSQKYIRVLKLQGSSYIATGQPRSNIVAIPRFGVLQYKCNSRSMAGCPIQPAFQDWTAWRQARGISLREIADTTKIGMRYLEDIERGAFDKLPGGAYTEGFIRQYASAVGDTGNILWDYYRLSVAPAEAPAAARQRENPPWRLGQMLRSLLGIAPGRRWISELLRL
jgi:transcriptional regulator with XRE-family HTH domain